MADQAYQLYVREGIRWRWLSELRAGSHPEAFRLAMFAVPYDCFDKPVRMEQSDSHVLPCDPEPGPAPLAN